MKIRELLLHPFEISLINGQKRPAVYIQIIDENGHEARGECAPLPLFSRESLEDCVGEFLAKHDTILSFEWDQDSLFQNLAKLSLLPALSFGLESALLMLLSPLPEHAIERSAFFMGSASEILSQADFQEKEGYTSAKVKVGNLNFDDAAVVIHQLKKRFHLRIDVNGAWKTTESIRFFSQFAFDDFDYVEEPFQNPKDLAKFLHPFAVDQSYPSKLSLDELESLPLLKAIVYKPTVQGGMLGCLPIREWAHKNQVALVLSSSFESPLGLSHIASMAKRLSLTTPIGTGTIHCLN